MSSNKYWLTQPYVKPMEVKKKEKVRWYYVKHVIE
jgi:hypothetical protein